MREIRIMRKKERLARPIHSLMIFDNSQIWCVIVCYISLTSLIYVYSSISKKVSDILAPSELERESVYKLIDLI